MIRRLLLAAFAAATTISFGFAGDWPQWRGAHRDGKSEDKGLLKSWPEGGPKLLWQIEDVGTGYGQPAVVGDKMYILGGSTNKMDSKDAVTCYSTKDGSKVWGRELDTTEGNYSDGWGGGPRNTPTVDGDRLYVLGATGDLYCLKTSDGSLVWSKNLVKDYDGKIPQWGYSESVLIDGDRLVCTPGNGTGMLALDKMTGKIIWACKDFKDGAGYSSIMISTVGGVKQYVQQTMAQGLAVNAKDGKLLWKTGPTIKRGVAVIPSPIVLESSVFFTSGYGAGCELIEMKANGDSVAGKPKYKSPVLANHHGGVILNNGVIFGHSDKGGWTCFDPVEGKELWQFGKFDKGSVTFADGLFYCYSQNTGELALVEPSKEDWKLISKFKIPETSQKRKGTMGQVWPHPVVANGMLFLRDYERLFVYNLKGSAE